MTEIEVPLEKTQEDIHHQALHGSGPSQKLMTRGALLSALLAVLAAIAALFAGHYANEAMIEQIQSSDHWAFYQAKGIKLAISEMRLETGGSEQLQEKIAEYRKEQEEIKAEAEIKLAESKRHLKQHESLAAAVTFFQIAIALTAISVLTRKPTFLFGAALLGVVGGGWLAFSLFF